MLAMLALYFWTMLAGAMAAPVLALLGAQLATRDRAMQTLCIGQGAMVGVLAGIGIVHTLELESSGPFGPLLSAFLFSSLTYLGTERLVAKKVASKNTAFALIFAVLLAAGYLMSALFPALENHMAQVYFGDLATLTESDSKATLILSFLCLTFLVVKSSAVSNQSFELAVFGDLVSTKSQRWNMISFKVVSLLMLCLSVQFIGFLFTVAMLFIPTGILNYLSAKGLRRHLILCAVLASFSTVVGFAISLQFTRIPTVPSIVVVAFIGSSAILAIERLKRGVFALIQTGPGVQRSSSP